MDQTLRAFASKLYQESRAPHDLAQPDRLQRYRNLEPETAEVLAVLAIGLRPRRILELGTSNGYSTLFLADVARDTGAKLVSVDTEQGAHSRRGRQPTPPPGSNRPRTSKPRMLRSCWHPPRTSGGTLSSSTRSDRPTPATGRSSCGP